MLLNTRPDDLAAALEDELKALGVESVHLPLLSIERLSVAPQAALAKNYRLVLCVSPRRSCCWRPCCRRGPTPLPGATSSGLST